MNYFQLRCPIFPLQGDTLPEPEIYSRLTISMGSLPKGAQVASVIWGLCLFYVKQHPKQVKQLGISGMNSALRESLFELIFMSDTTVTLSQHTYEEMCDLMGYKDKKVRLAIPEMLDALRALTDENEDLFNNAAYPFVLSAGERRSYNAKQIYRDPSWRKKDLEGTLRIYPENPAELKQHGPEINRLTVAFHCDPTAKTPYHKFVPVRLAPLSRE